MDLSVNENYLRDQKRLLQYYFENDVFIPNGEKYQLNIMKLAVEFVVRPDCNQRCEYCYLTKFGKDLYPNNVSKNEILKNIDLYLDFIIHENKSYTYLWELFAGDLMFDKIYFDILDIFDKYFDEILINYPSHFKKHQTVITLPTNLWWIEDNEIVERFYQYFDYFKEKYNTKLGISCSTDGMYCTDSREKKTLTQDYFDKQKVFIEKVEGGFHPMVSALNIKQWNEKNLDWWYTFLDENFPMMLEVRNDDWTEESIEEYKKFLEKIFYMYLKKFDDNKTNFSKFIFHNSKKSNGYIPIFFYHDFKENYKNERTSCSMQSIITFNCTNLSMPICHRLSYPLFEGCQFILNEEQTKIIDYIPHNIDTYFAVKFMKDKNQPGCINCIFNNICLKGCLGAQYETHGDLLIRCESVCKFFEEKYKKLFELYYTNDIFKEAFENDFIDEEQKENILNMLKELGYENVNECCR